MITRRRFLGGSAVFGAALFTPLSLGSVLSHRLSTRKSFSLTAPLLEQRADEKLITIIHTNDTHSQIDPFPVEDRQYPGQGGVARRATLVKRVRDDNPNTLLIDAGDSFQGTPYFNFYKGEVEYRAMSGIGYDVGTLGNHEFDNGVAALAVAMKFASFDFVSSNYDVRGTVLEKRVKRYVVRELAGVRIGLFGLGVSPTGLITPDNFQGITYQDPVEASRSVIKILKETERCHLIVCMSHLGYYKVPKGNEIGDTQVAAQVDGIDFIASGHTHTFMKQPVVQKQPSGKDTIIFQVGKSGINLGRVDFTIRAGQVTAWAGHLLDLRHESLS
jgi:5'-nucleotidase